jgi:hypothetical protein
MGQAITSLTCTPWVSGSNLGRDTDHPEVLRGIPLSLPLQAEDGTVTQNGSRPLPFTNNPIIQRYIVSATDSVVKQVINTVNIYLSTSMLYFTPHRGKHLK